jgi:hypothetical protein
MNLDAPALSKAQADTLYTSTTKSFDVVVFGANSGGIMAAISAARFGMKVCLIADRNQIGGMVTSGINLTDVSPSFSKGQVRGIGDEFYARLAMRHGLPQNYWCGNWSYSTSPWKAQIEINEMIKESGIELRMNEQLINVTKSGTTITQIKTTGGKYIAKQFIDGTYHLDLSVAAGCTTTFGREANATYSETLNGLTALVNAAGPVDPYITPGVKASGLLYPLNPTPTGAVGAADPHVQVAWNRIYWTKNAGFKIAFSSTPPTGYDATKYEYVGRYFVAHGSTWTTAAQYFNIRSLSDGNFDINGSGIGSDWADPQVQEWITATPARRLVIEQGCQNYTLGLIYFLRTDSRTPAAFKTDLNLYGWDKRAWPDNNNFPPLMYMRESRRLVGDTVLAQSDISNFNGTYVDPIALTYYTYDCHGCQYTDNNGALAVEGVIAADPGPGRPISMKALWPKVAECTNLQVTFGVSVSHVVYAVTRLEPMSMMFGEAAGTIAAWAVQNAQTVQAIPYSELSVRLNPFGFQAGSGAFMNADGTSSGVVTTTGTWTSSAGSGFYSPGTTLNSSVSTDNTTPALKKFRPLLLESGWYDLFMLSLTSNTLRSQKTPVTVVSNNGQKTEIFTFDQNNPPTNTYAGSSGDWDFVGSFYFQVGTSQGASSPDYVTIGPDASGGKCSISAFKWLPRGKRGRLVPYGSAQIV